MGLMNRKSGSSRTGTDITPLWMSENRTDTAAEMGLNVADKGPRGPVFRPHDGARLACGPSVGEFVGLVESSTYAGKSARIVASIRTETGSLSFLAQPQCELQAAFAALL